MELVYLWVEEYKNIKKQGFNFSPRFSCEYNEDTNELTIDENDDYIDGFFGDNINVTAIVGKNGSGKSSLLELILRTEHWFSTDMKMFFVVQDNKNFILHHLNFSKEILCEKSPLKIKQEKTHRGIDDDIPIHGIGIHFVYLSLSPFLHSINTFYSLGYFDFYSIYNYLEHYENKDFNFDDFFLGLVPKIMDILNNKVIRDFFGINAKPNCLAFKLSKEMKDAFPDEVQTVFDNSKEMPSFNDEYFRYVSSDNISSFENVKNLQERIKQRLLTLSEDINKIKQKVEEDEDKFPIPELKNRKKNMYDKMYDPYSDPVFDVIRDEREDEHVSKKINRAASIRIKSNKKKIESIETQIKGLADIQFYFAQNENSKETFFFSAGELVLLFYIDKLLQISNKKINFTLLIDESELHLHPNWQKKFIHLLCDLLSHKEYKRKIIITSHSPFLVSDLPKQNIIFLKEGKQVKGTDKKQTFGANIHTLLSDSFFMEDGLMGEFAQKKINELIDYLNDKKTSIKEDAEAQKLINIIGEPIVKNQLQKMLDSKRLSKIDKIKQDIINLQNELKGLQNGQK